MTQTELENQKVFFRHLLFKDRRSGDELFNFVSNLIMLIQQSHSGSVKRDTVGLRMLLERMDQKDIKTRSSFNRYKQAVLKELKTLGYEVPDRYQWHFSPVGDEYQLALR